MNRKNKNTGQTQLDKGQTDRWRGIPNRYKWIDRWTVNNRDTNIQTKHNWTKDKPKDKKTD